MRWLYLAPIAIFAVVAGYLAVGLTRNPGTLPSALLDKPVPEFALPPLVPEKTGLASADLKGAPVLVNVWASWCVPCRAEHPILIRLAREVPIFGFNYKDKPEDAKRFLAELGDPYAKIGTDPSGRVGIDWGVYGVPETFVVDAEGRIRHRHVGPLTDRAVAETIRPLLKSLTR
ncbi:MAG: DsbE family thiol:disulfide interchange protein [Alphaproteobacteria bacterium]|nr:DsbE family thiol:disulfide interchange protein [Alphaproteobacteria bacterium]